MVDATIHPGGVAVNVFGIGKTSLCTISLDVPI
jgi:hypothetical protein